MKTPDEPKKNLMILVAKGKDKKSRKQLKQGFEKKYFFMCSCQSSGERELNSYTSIQNMYAPSLVGGVQN